MKVSGFGAVTTKGLDIFEYCKTNAVELEFTTFFATNKGLSLSQIAEPLLYADMLKSGLETDLSGNEYFEGSISGADHYIAQNSVYLPLLLSLVSNDYNEDLQISTVFILAIDPEDGEEYVVYVGCPAYDEQQTFSVDDSTGFVVGDVITTAGGARAEILAINGNTFRINRQTVIRFENGEVVDSGVVTATIISDPRVDVVNSTVLPLTYITDGANILLRTSLRSTSGFPKNIRFLSTAVTEIEIHDVSPTAHLDIRAMVEDNEEKINSHYTQGDVTIILDITEIDESLDSLNEYFDKIRHNDYTITIQCPGGFPHPEGTIKIHGITGSGRIVFEDGIAVERIQIFGVKNEIIFEDNARMIGWKEKLFEVRDSYRVYFKHEFLARWNNLELTATESDWLLVSIQNSTVVFENDISFNGNFGGTGFQTPTHLVKIFDNSLVLFLDPPELKSATSAGDVLGRSAILVDKSSRIEFSTGIGYVLDEVVLNEFYLNFACVVEAVNYPRCWTPYVFSFAFSDGVAMIKQILFNLESNQGDIEINDFGGGISLVDLEIPGITGTGTITFESVDFSSNNRFYNIENKLTFSGGQEVEGQSIDQYGIEIHDCKCVEFIDVTNLTDTDRNYPCILIDNSKVFFEDLKNLEQPIGSVSSFVIIDNQSDVFFKEITAGQASQADGRAYCFEVKNGSKVNVYEFRPGHVDVTLLRATLNLGGHCIGYTGADWELRHLFFDIVPF